MITVYWSPVINVADNQEFVSELKYFTPESIYKDMNAKQFFGLGWTRIEVSHPSQTRMTHLPHPSSSEGLGWRPPQVCGGSLKLAAASQLFNREPDEPNQI